MKNTMDLTIISYAIYRQMSFTAIPTSAFMLSRANAKKKQPLGVFYKNVILKKFGKFKTPVPESLF